MLILFDPVLQIHPEYEGYNGELINQVLLFNIPRIEFLKFFQPDVVLLQYPLMVNMPREIALNDLKYYLNKTNPASFFTGKFFSEFAYFLKVTMFTAFCGFNTGT